MSLLSELIPAIREIRSALVGGYLWLLLIWLKVADDIPLASEVRRGTVADHFHRLSEVGGPFSLVIALSVAAYLIGSLVDEGVKALLGRRLPFDRHTLDLMIGEFPDVQSMVDRVDRAYSEAEFRVHVALPLAAIALVLPECWAHVVGLLVAAALAFHGWTWRKRSAQLFGVVNSLVGRRKQDAIFERHGASHASVRLRVQRRDQKDQVLTVMNEGPGIAKGIDIRDMDRAELRFIVSGILPIEELRPNDAVDLPLAVAFGEPTMTPRVMVTWEDGEGFQSDEVMIFLTN